MVAVRGTYDGKEVHILPSEKLPQVAGEVPVAIIFLDEPMDDERRRLQVEAARRMLARRAEMAPLDVSVKDLIEEGRVR